MKVTPKSTQKVDYVKVNKPELIDWRDKCLVNQIRDQGLCSSGYVSAMTQAHQSLRLNLDQGLYSSELYIKQ